MAKAISNQMSDSLPYVGCQLLDVVTSGMYSDPLMVLREYVQNAADAIDSACRQRLLCSGRGRISITLDPENRNITIEDNGTGLSCSETGRLLCGMGISSKDSSENRGFRGIGRFGGLGYCKSIRFETKCKNEETITKIEWDAGRLSQYSSRRAPLDMREAFSMAGSMHIESASPSTPSHFFRVKMIGVTQFHKDPLMDIKNIRRYLGQVAPVPFDETVFRYAREIQQHLDAFSGFRQYRIAVNEKAVYRPHCKQFTISGKTTDSIRGIELFDFRDYHGGILAKGWFAKTSFLASLPKSVEMRGMRVCQGNMEVGGPRFLAQYFKERRFATWHIGEIHVSRRIRPNARRDGFEQNSAYEIFLEQAFVLGQHLSKICRGSSKKRTAKLTFERRITKAIDSMASRVYLNHDHQEEVFSKIDAKIDKLDDIASHYSWPNAHRLIADARCRLEQLKMESLSVKDCIDGRRLRGSNAKAMLKDVCQQIIHERDNGRSFDSLLENILQPYLKQHESKRWG